jgi:shikimate kinase
MEIVLMGYMGSGKSTIGKSMAKKNNLEFIDLDHYIELQEKQSINAIFKNKGEIYFRLQEAKYLQEILHSKTNFVLSLGGGTPCYANNTEVIAKSNGISIYLKAKIPTLHQRLKNESSNRPLIASLNDEDLYEYIGKHLFERAPFYEQADVNISIDGKNIDEICIEIQKQLH